MFTSAARFADAAKSSNNCTTKKTCISVKNKKPSNSKAKLIARFRSLNENCIAICITCHHWLDLRDEVSPKAFLDKYAANKIVDNFPIICNQCKSKKSIIDQSIELKQRTQDQINEYEEAILNPRSEISSLSQRLHTIESNINYHEQIDHTSYFQDTISSPLENV